MEVEIQANAKVNLALDVLREREDGYHEIDTIMQEISLHDTLTIEKGRGGFVLACDEPKLRLDDSNLVYKAWNALRDRVEDPSVIIEIEKQIPIAAGLAGGSADAAATLCGLNELWGLELSQEELENIAAAIDSDSSFFIRGGTQRAQGRGEILTPLPSFYGRPLLLINTGDTLSTRSVYEKTRVNGKIPVSELIDYLGMERTKAYSLMQNQLENASFEILPKLKEIKMELQKTGALVSMMSGSGPTIFAIYESMDEAEKAQHLFEPKFPFVFLARTV